MSENEDERIEVGDLVRTENGNAYPVVGREQGGRTMSLPCGPGGATRNFFRDDLELIEKDVSLYRAYNCGRESAPVDKEVAETVASLAIEGHIKQSALPVLFTVLGEDVTIKVADRLEGEI